MNQEGSASESIANMPSEKTYVLRTGEHLVDFYKRTMDCAIVKNKQKLRSTYSQEPEKLNAIDKIFTFVEDEINKNIVNSYFLDKLTNTDFSAASDRRFQSFKKLLIHQQEIYNSALESAKAHYLSSIPGYNQKIIDTKDTLRKITSWVIIPALSFAVFNRYLIPALDRHLQEKKWTEKNRKKAIIASRIGAIVASAVLGYVCFVAAEKTIFSADEKKGRAFLVDVKQNTFLFSSGPLSIITEERDFF